MKIFFTIASTIGQCLISGKFRAFAAHPSVPMPALSFQFVGSGLDAIDTSLHCAYFWKTKLGTFTYFFSTRSLLSSKYHSKYAYYIITVYIYIYINHMISPQLEDPELRVCGYDMTMGVQKAFWTSGTYFRSHLFTWHSLMYDWSAKGKLKWIMWAVFGVIGSSLSTQPQPERSFKNFVEILKTQQLESTSATAKSLSSAFHQFHLCSPHLVTAEFVLAARGSILQGFSLRRKECRKTHARAKFDVWFWV